MFITTLAINILLVFYVKNFSEAKNILRLFRIYTFYTIQIKKIKCWIRLGNIVMSRKMGIVMNFI